MTDVPRGPTTEAWLAVLWAAQHQAVTAHGRPTDPADAGRDTVRENADALRRLRDA